MRACEATREFVEEAYTAGLQAMAWFPGKEHDSVADLQRLLGIDVDHICTNLPGHLHEVCWCTESRIIILTACSKEVEC